MSIAKRGQSAVIGARTSPVRRDVPPRNPCLETPGRVPCRSTPGREVLAVGGAGAAGAASFGGGAQFEAQHGQSAGAVADHGFGKENLAKARHVNGMAAGFYAGRPGLDAAALDERAE